MVAKRTKSPLEDYISGTARIAGLIEGI